MNETLRLAEVLISKASVTPDDAGCQELLADELQPLGSVPIVKSNHISKLRLSQLLNIRLSNLDITSQLILSLTNAAKTSIGSCKQIQTL